MAAASAVARGSAASMTAALASASPSAPGTRTSASAGPDPSPAAAAMDPRDRTNEFRAAVESARRPTFLKRSNALKNWISQTSFKIDSLDRAVSVKSISVCYPTVDIPDLTAVIKKDIAALSAALVELKVWKDSQNETGNLSKDTTDHYTVVVDELQKHFMAVIENFEKVTKQIEDLKAQKAARMQMISLPTAKDASNPFIRQGPLVAREPSTQLFQRKKAYADHGASSSSQPFVQQQQLTVQQDSYMQSRDEGLQNLEITIHEISNVYTQLATLVSQQGELAIRIDDYMEKTMTNDEGTQGQLLKYLNSISSNRWLMMKIFLVLMVFLMIFIFFVA